MKINTDLNTINKILDRGVVVNILPTRQNLVDKLTSGNRLRFYIGADATSGSLHLSHAKNYMLLEEIRQLGHEVIVLLGDFTAMIGDPTDRSDTRPILSAEQIKENIKGWINQIRPLMDFDCLDNPPKILFNSKWLASLSFSEVLELVANFTVQQMMERDMFESRLKKGQPIFLHEFLYPVMQAYDSVAMDVDVELCGTDQTFNALAGRSLVKRLNNKDKSVLIVNLMENPDTGELMSKSRGTGVFLSSGPAEMFGAIMAQNDSMTEVLLINNTRISLLEVKKIMSLHPKEAKLAAAHEIVRIFYGAKLAEESRDAWISQFTNKNLPEHIAELVIICSKQSVIDLIMQTGLIKSRSKARRLVSEAAIKLNGAVIADEIKVGLRTGDILRIGKKDYVRIKIEENNNEK
jgi:tyrosyl-tRNA synthetase